MSVHGFPLFLASSERNVCGYHCSEDWDKGRQSIRAYHDIPEGTTRIDTCGSFFEHVQYNPLPAASRTQACSGGHRDARALEATHVYVYILLHEYLRRL